MQKNIAVVGIVSVVILISADKPVWAAPLEKGKLSLIPVVEEKEAAPAEA